MHIVCTEWDKNKYNNLIQELIRNTDSDFLQFNKKLIFTKYSMIGIRTPILKDIAKKISKGNIISYLDNCNCTYYEEILLFGFVLSYVKDLDLFFRYFYKFISYIDNWAVCDMCIASMKIIKKNKDVFLSHIKNLINSKEEYYVRVGVIILLDYYLDDMYIDQVFELLDSIDREEYYINMAIAWCISICFIKYRDKTLSYLSDCKLNKFTFNKALQKARESKRISIEDKMLLQDMKIK